MFDPASRYHSLPNRTIRDEDGSEYVYRARRFIPRAQQSALRPGTAVEVTVRDGDRLDTIAARELGDPLAFWRIADANPALNPFELARPGTRLVITASPPSQLGEDSE